MRIALVHDYLNEAGGAERVLRVLADMYPEAPIYTSFAKKGSALSLFADKKVIESPWGWFLRIGRFYSYFRMFLPWVWRSIDLTGYDCIITSCSGYIARGFRVKDSARVIAYCHTPPKWLYGYDTPTDGKRTWWGKLYLFCAGPYVRYFDYTSAQRVNMWVANSQEVAKRIRKFYRAESRVIYPPVVIHAVPDDWDRKPLENTDTYYLAVARVVGAKGLELAALAARATRRHLVIAGEFVGGTRILNRLRALGGRWVTYTGRVDDSELARLYTGATAYIALARDEDFGMTVVEAMGHGIPVVAVKSGGYKETVTEGETGIFIGAYTASAVAEAIALIEGKRWDKKTLVARARAFSRSRFERAMREVVDARTIRI